MTILYLSVSYVPSRRASSVQVMKMCEALARAGHDVTLVTKACPSRQEPGVKDDHAYYGVAGVFPVHKVPRPAWRGGGVVYSLGIWRLLRRMREGTDLVYSRDLPGAWMALHLGCRVLFEVHEVPAGARSRRLLRGLLRHPRCVRLVAISAALRDDLERSGVLDGASASILVAHDGAEAQAHVPEGEAATGNGVLGETPGPHVGYVGSLNEGKGVDVVAALAARMPTCTFHVVGGREPQLQAWCSREGLPGNLLFHGFVEPARLHAYYRAMNVLLLPNQRRVYGATGRVDIGRWTSPLKLFEYMSSGRPIVSSDLPVLREVLAHERNALLVPPDDLPAWEHAVERVLADVALALRLGRAARRDLEDHYTWTIRASRVLHGLS